MRLQICTPCKYYPLLSYGGNKAILTMYFFVLKNEISMRCIYWCVEVIIILQNNS